MRVEESVRERCEENKNGFGGEPAPSRGGEETGCGQTPCARTNGGIMCPGINREPGHILPSTARTCMRYYVCIIYSYMCVFVCGREVMSCYIYVLYIYIYFSISGTQTVLNTVDADNIGFCAHWRENTSLNIIRVIYHRRISTCRLFVESYFIYYYYYVLTYLSRPYPLLFLPPPPVIRKFILFRTLRVNTRRPPRIGIARPKGVLTGR